MISPVINIIIIIFVILLILLGILLIHKKCNKHKPFLNNNFVMGGNFNSNNNFLIFSDKEMNSHIKNLLESFKWKCDNNSKYIHFSFVEDHKYHGHRYVRDHISHHITPVHHYITPANSHISPPAHHNIALSDHHKSIYTPHLTHPSTPHLTRPSTRPIHHNKSSIHHISPPLNYKSPATTPHNMSLQPHPYYRHGGDLYFENIHHHDNYEVPHNENLYSLIGEIKILGLEFSDKKKMMHHFEKKDFFPKWSKNGINISKGDKITVNSTNVAGGKEALSRYIDNPLLYNGHKFNLQVYIAMYVQDDKLIQAFINPNYNMQVALLPYTNTDYDNNDIHISNITNFDKIELAELHKREKYLTKLLENKQIKKQVYHIIHECELVTKHMVNKLKIHAIAAFELLTLDILIDNEYKVWLLDMHRTKDKELGKENNSENNSENNEEKVGGKLGEKIQLTNHFERYWNWVLKNVILANFGLHTSIWGIYNVLPVMTNELWHESHEDHKEHLHFLDYYKLPKVVAHQLILQPLHLAIDQELVELSHFGVLKSVYQYISYGSRKWDISYIKKIYNEAVEESHIHYRNYYHWLMIYDGHCVGYFGIRPDIDNNINACKIQKEFKIPEKGVGSPILLPSNINCYQVRYFVSPSYQGKKLASMGGRHIVHFFKSI